MLSTPTRTLPDSGTFTIAAWGEALDITEVSVREYIQRYAIPTDGQTIDAAVWWRTLAKGGRQPVATEQAPVKRSRRRRGKGGGSIKPVPDGLDLKQMKSRIPQGKLVVTFLSGLSPAAKGFALAYLLEQARKAQQAKAKHEQQDQAKPEGGEQRC